MRAAGLIRTSWWGLPTRNTLDRGTALLPDLLAARLPELGIDHAILYPTYGLVPAALDDAVDPPARWRARSTRSTRRRSATTPRRSRRSASSRCTPRRRRSPSSTTRPASSVSRRSCSAGRSADRRRASTRRHARRAGSTRSGLDSVYDYDPVWQRCVELGVSPTFHTAAMGWTVRASVSNYVFNHIGMFAIAGELARAVAVHGRRARSGSRQLRFAFQEGGVAWAAALLREPRRPLGEAQPRRGRALQPGAPRPRAGGALFEEYGSTRYRERLDQLDDGLRMLSLPDEDPATLDEFARCGIDERRRHPRRLHDRRSTSGARPTTR